MLILGAAPLKPPRRAQISLSFPAGGNIRGCAPKPPQVMPAAGPPPCSRVVGYLLHSVGPCGGLVVTCAGWSRVGGYNYPPHPPWGGRARGPHSIYRGALPPLTPPPGTAPKGLGYPAGLILSMDLSEIHVIVSIRC